MWIEIISLDETHLINFQNVCEVEPIEKDEEQFESDGICVKLNNQSFYNVIGLDYKLIIEALKNINEPMSSFTVDRIEYYDSE